MVVWEKVPAQTTGACAMTSPPTDLQSSEWPLSRPSK
jgi:hypothetical protein